MSEHDQEKKSGCSKPVITFFIIAVAIVAAFLIIGLVTKCDTDHEDDIPTTVPLIEQNVQP